MKITSIVIGGSSGFGKYLVKYLKKKKHNVYFTGTKKKKGIKNYLKFDLFETEDQKKLFKNIKNIKNINNIFYGIGDSNYSEEKIVNFKLLKKLLFINLDFPIKLLKFLDRYLSDQNIKILFFGSDSVFNLKAKPSTIISKASQIYLVKSHKFYFDKTNKQVSTIILSPLLFPGSYWSKIKKIDKKKFDKKNKLNIFKHPRNYFKIIDTVLKTKKINGRVFKLS